MACINLKGTLGHIIDFDLLPDDAIIVDCGACVGDFIHRLDQEVDASNFRIIGFEPCKTNLENMPQWKKRLNVEIHGKAVVGQNFPDHVTFYEFNGLEEWGNIMGLYMDRWDDDSREYLVETITLEKMFEAYNISHIDYLKLDIEGSETDLVKTMTQDLANKINQLSMEVHNKDEEELALVLQNLGFSTRFDRPNELYGSRV